MRHEKYHEHDGKRSVIDLVIVGEKRSPWITIRRLCIRINKTCSAELQEVVAIVRRPLLRPSMMIPFLARVRGPTMDLEGAEMEMDRVCNNLFTTFHKFFSNMNIYVATFNCEVAEFDGVLSLLSVPVGSLSTSLNCRQCERPTRSTSAISRRRGEQPNLIRQWRR